VIIRNLATTNRLCISTEMEETLQSIQTCLPIIGCWYRSLTMFHRLV